AMGTRDRSWGVRPIGDSDQQPIVPPGPQGYFWQWTPLNFSDFSLFYHISAEADGTVWNRRSALVPHGAAAEGILETDRVEMQTELAEGTVWPSRGLLSADYPDGTYRVELVPFQQFQMKGAGYFHPTWYHGRYHGALKVEREDFAVDPM